MKKNLIIGLFIMMIFVTGCEVNYELNFTDNILDETISIVLSENESTSENLDRMDYMSKNEAFAISSGIVQESYKYVRKGNTGSLNYKYDINNFSDNHSIDQCYDSFNFVETDDGYLLITSDMFRCATFSYIPVDKYNITITTNREVLDNNADKIDGNKYIWEIDTREKVEVKKPIKIKFSYKTQKDILMDKLSKNSNYVLAGILGAIFIAVVILFIVFTAKRKKSQS